MSKAKILIYDIETAPIIGTSWKTYDTSLVWVIQDWYMMSYAWKWLGQKKVYVKAITDYPRYKKDHEDDLDLVRDLHKLFEEADVVIAHNGDRFDQKKSNARYLYHGMAPPKPYKSIDTLKIARRYFALSSYKLDDLGEYLGVGKKISTDKTLWQKCMAGDMKAWRKMKRYNKQDVQLLEDIYLKLRPWIDNHPSISVMNDRPKSCPKCGSENIQSRGWGRMTKIGKRRQFQCQGCGGWLYGRIQVTNKEITEVN